jgi:hypothetical protein
VSIFDLIDPADSQYWGIIWGAAEQGLPTEGVYELIYQHAYEQGLTWSPSLFQSVNTLRAAAGSLVGSETQLTKMLDYAEATDTVQGVQGSMWTYAPWGRGILPESQYGSESYVLRAEVKFGNELYDPDVPGSEEFVYDWVTIRTKTMPLTSAEIDSKIMGYQPTEDSPHASGPQGYKRVLMYQT